MILWVIVVLADPGNINARVDPHPVKAWIKSLTSSQEPPPISLLDITKDLIASDSITRCNVIQFMIGEGPTQQTRYKIRLNHLLINLTTNNIPCSSSLHEEELLKEALKLSFELNDNRLVYQTYLKGCELYNYRNDYGNASFYGLLAYEFWNKHFSKEYNFYPYVFYVLAYTNYYTGEYRSALDYSFEALKEPEYPVKNAAEILTESEQMFTWNLIGLAYEKLQVYDSAFYAFDQSLIIARKNQHSFWIGLLQGNRGDVFYAEGKFDSAVVLLNADYKASLSVKEYDNASNTLQWLARITSGNGDHQKALQMLHEAMRLYDQKPEAKYLENILGAYVDVYSNMKFPDSAQFYMKQYMHLHDSLQQIAFAGKAEILNMRLNNQQSIDEIKDLQKEKRRVVLIRNFIILFILLSLGFVLLYFNRQRLKMKLHQQQVLEEKRKAEAEVAMAQEKLEALTERLLERNQLVENLQSQMMEKGLTDSQIQDIQALSQHTILTDADWSHFREHFEKVYPGFFIRLKNQAPDISLAELRMAALSKLKLTSKEAGTLLGISRDSANKSRQRLRQRLGLDPDADLEKYFSQV